MPGTPYPKCDKFHGTLCHGYCTSAEPVPVPKPTPKPHNPCGKRCRSNADCNQKGGFWQNECGVGGTRCAGRCFKTGSL